VKALVIAAGEGTRMRPLTANRPKAMLPVANRPILEHLLAALREAGVEEVSVVVGYRKDKLEGYFGDGSGFGLDLSYIHQQRQRGTGDAVACASDWNEPFLAVNGDLLVGAGHLRRVMGSPADAVVSVREVPDPRQMGVVDVEGGKVRRIIEKSPDPPTRLANAGVYRFPPKVFQALADCRLSPRGEIEVTDAVNRLVEMGLGIEAIPVEGEWLDVGRPWDLLAANEAVLARESREWRKDEIDGVVEPNVHAHGPVAVGENTRLRSGTYIEGPVLIGEDCDIGPNCYIRGATSIGDRVRIGNAVEVKNSVIMDGTHVGHLSYVGDSVVGPECNFGAGTKTANLRLDGENVPVTARGETVDSGRRKLGAILGDGVSLGINCSLDCGVVLEAGAGIPPHTLVDRNWKTGKGDNLR